MDVDNYTLTSNGKNASLRCANYTNVYHVEGTAVKFTTNTVASSASALLDYVDADRLAHLYNMNFSNMTTVLDTYFSTIWYYYNPPLTQNVYVNSVDNVLPQGQQFLATTAFAVSGASTNLNNSWANNSNHSQGYVNGVITVRPNADLRSFNVTSNETYPVLAYGYVIIPSARLVQNQRVIVSDLEASKCVNATLKHTGLTNVTTSYYSDTGAITAPVTDIAYLSGVKLSGAQTGEVNVSDNAGTLLYTVAAGRTIPIDNGGSQMCLNSNGCTITNLMYGGDALWKLSVRVIGASANTTKMAVYQAAGSSVFGFGQNVIHWNAGQRLVFFGKGYVNSTNVSIYYEGG